MKTERITYLQGNRWIQTIIELPNHLSVQRVEREVNYLVRHKKLCSYADELINEDVFPRQLGPGLSYLLEPDVTLFASLIP